MTFTRRGTAHTFGHDISNDDGIIPFSMIRDVSYNPSDPHEDAFARYCMAGVDPTFADRARQGDILVVGRRFGHGNVHIQSCFAIKGLGLSVVAESTARGFLRSAVAAGVLILPRVPNLLAQIQDGTGLEVDYRAGTVTNLETGKILQGNPMPSQLLEVVHHGGLDAWLRWRLSTTDTKDH